MKKLFASTGEGDVSVAVTQDLIQVDNKYLEILSEYLSGYLVKIDNQEIVVDDIFLLENGVYRVEIQGYTIDVGIKDPVTLALGEVGEKSGTLKAPMAGQISKILVEVGDSVTAGQVILVISAMKMENQIISTIDGIISEINTEEGESVPAGKLLVRITKDE